MPQTRPEYAQREYQEQKDATERKRNIGILGFDTFQKLVTFVSSSELIFCGYILINANTTAAIPGVPLLFLVAGAAAMSGQLYKLTYSTYMKAIEMEDENARTISWKLSQSFRLGHLTLSFAFFLSFMAMGYLHLLSVADEQNPYQNPTVELNGNP